MSAIIEDLSSPSLLEAVEANFSEEMATFGRGLPGSLLHEDAELLWFFTGRNHLNGVLRTHLLQNDERYVNDHIRRMQAFFQGHASSFAWTVGPTTQPTTMTDFLLARGFSLVATTECLTLDLATLPETTPRPGGLQIGEMRDAEALRPLIMLEQEGFSASPELAQSYYDAYVGVGFGGTHSWHHYLASLDSEPAGIVSLLLHAGIAGIFGVATHPAFRRKGVGAALTLHALHEAKARGYRVAVLSPTEMSLQIYRRLGFEQVCTLYHYGWTSTT